jgi:hypothetical protein
MNFGHRWPIKIVQWRQKILSKPVTSSETESVIESLPKEKGQGLHGLIAEFYQTFQKY